MKEQEKRVSIFALIFFGLSLFYDFIDAEMGIRLDDASFWIQLSAIVLILINLFVHSADLKFAPIVSWLIAAAFMFAVCYTAYDLIHNFIPASKAFLSSLEKESLDAELVSLLKLDIALSYIDYGLLMAIFVVYAFFFAPIEKPSICYILPRVVHIAYLVFTVGANLLFQLLF